MIHIGQYYKHKQSGELVVIDEKSKASVGFIWLESGKLGALLLDDFYNEFEKV